MRELLKKSWLLGFMLPLLLAVPVHSLDTSAGVGLQDRALFQEKVDYTLTNQSGADFHDLNLTNTSFAGAVGRGARRGRLQRRFERGRRGRPRHAAPFKKMPSRGDGFFLSHG